MVRKHLKRSDTASVDSSMLRNFETLLTDGRGGGVVVSALAFYSKDPGQNPTGY